MLKKAMIRGMNSFVYATTINVIICCIVMVLVNKPDFIPMLPEFSARFSSDIFALIVQLILIGITSASFGFWSIIMEFGRISLLVQSILYFILTAIVWVPVAIICWGLGKYVSTFISISLSYLIAYIISWTVQYRSCKESVKQINQKLKEMREEEWDTQLN